MDKYAVDLDQVLNDFEYSELTDQHNNATRSASTASSLGHNTVTKHSINNVFHSLNEYLNTTITVNQIDNNLSLENKENAINVIHNKIRDEESETSIKECNVKTDTVLLDFNGKRNEDNKVSEPEVRGLEENTDTVETCEIDEKEEETEVYINKTRDESVSEEIEPPATEIIPQVKDEVEEIEEKPVIDDSAIETLAKTIGFDENLDMDDGEVLKLLEELEDEGLESDEVLQPQTEHDLVESNQSESVTHTNDCQLEDKQHQETAPSPDLKPLVESNSEPSVNENVVTNEEPVDEQPVKTEQASILPEPLVFESEPTPKMTGDPTVIPEAVSVETVAVTETEEEEETRETQLTEETVEEKPTEKETEEESSVDSVSRPRDLPLNGEGDQPKRKIDLIGDPGSTPYNNVYINKEIPKNKDDSDTDYSTSSSPTFSDASSTASTVSAEEAQNTNENIKSKDASNVDTEPEPQVATNPTPDDIANPASDFVPEQTLVPEMTADATERQWLGKEAPLWVPDSDATSCLHCDMKFTVLKRRHHCRACGLVLCSKCCHLRFRLEYLDAEARVCNRCHDLLNRDEEDSPSGSDAGNSPLYRPNPNNPSEYCSTVSPLQQVAGANAAGPPAVMVPVGVLKRKGSNKGKSNKSVMFCDGIRPGSDLTNLDSDFDYNNTKTKRPEKAVVAPAKPKRNLPIVDPETNTFIPSNENCLPPTVVISKTEISYSECPNDPSTVETLKNEQLTFALQVNLYVHVKIVSMSCCVNRTAWCFSTEGLINVGQDEIVILLEYIEEESFVPKDVFYHINNVHNDAVKGTSVKELGLSLHNASNFLDSKNHAGFVYIRPTFQCLENVIKPKEPYLIGILIHRWETPWAKLFPLRLVLRLGAEYRYYPSPIISTRHRESVFVEIGHTIINLLADFRNFSYTLPQIRGLTIHMEDKNTTITIPANRYDQVMKSVSNSSDHILAFAGNFSQRADSHLVCIQDTQGNENCYSTHAINIHNKPRKVTGASFIVFNGALKSSSGLTAKSNIVEDGLMIQVPAERMQLIRDDLRAMRDHQIPCGCVDAATDETVNIVWGEDDVNFNVGVVSAIDDTPLAGVPSIRVHNAKSHVCANGARIIRWTEVFIVQNGEDGPKNQDSVDVSRVSESIAKATCDALVKYLDLLVANGCQKIGIRTTLHADNVSYLAGSNGAKLAPIYMKSLDNELVPVLHRITTNNLGEHSVVLELIFRILNL